MLSAGIFRTELEVDSTPPELNFEMLNFWDAQFIGQVREAGPPGSFAVPMDGLDALLAEAVADKAAKQDERRQTVEAAIHKRSEVEQRQRARSALLDKCATSDSAAASSARVQHYAEALDAYLQRLVDTSELEQIHAALAARSYEECIAYYNAHPELSEYTLSRELGRMEYTVRIDGLSEPLKNPTAIRSALERENLTEIAAATAPTTDPRCLDPRCFLLRAANQSIIADLLVPLQGRWMDADLSIAVIATASAFVLDLRAAHMSLAAHCHLAIQTLGAGDEALPLASCELEVCLVPSKRSLVQRVHRPRLCESVVFEEARRGVAVSLARCTPLEEGRNLGGGNLGGGNLEGDNLSGDAARRGGEGEESPSLDALTKQLEDFMSAEGEDGSSSSGGKTAACSGSQRAGSGSGTGSLLSAAAGLFTGWP